MAARTNAAPRTAEATLAIIRSLGDSSQRMALPIIAGRRRRVACRDGLLVGSPCPSLPQPYPRQGRQTVYAARCRRIWRRRWGPEVRHTATTSCAFVPATELLAYGGAEDESRHHG